MFLLQQFLSVAHFYYQQWLAHAHGWAVLQLTAAFATSRRIVPQLVRGASIELAAARRDPASADGQGKPRMLLLRPDTLNPDASMFRSPWRHKCQVTALFFPIALWRRITTAYFTIYSFFLLLFPRRWLHSRNKVIYATRDIDDTWNSK